MSTARSIAAIATMTGLVVALGACSSDDDAPPASDPAASVVRDVSEATVVTAVESMPEATSEPSVSVPATGGFSIDGPASVDPEFGGANPGGDEAGG